MNAKEFARDLGSALRRDTPAFTGDDDLRAENERLRRDLETMTAVARGNKRHVAMLIPDADKLEKIREYVAQLPPEFPDNAFTAEAQFVRDIRRLLEETA